MRPATYAREFDVAWAKRGLEAVRNLGFRAYHDEKGALRIVDVRARSVHCRRTSSRGSGGSI
jgi:hypothetical protein